MYNANLEQHEIVVLVQDRCRYNTPVNLTDGKTASVVVTYWLASLGATARIINTRACCSRSGISAGLASVSIGSTPSNLSDCREVFPDISLCLVFIRDWSLSLSSKKAAANSAAMSVWAYATVGGTGEALGVILEVHHLGENNRRSLRLLLLGLCCCSAATGRLFLLNTEPILFLSAVKTIDEEREAFPGRSKWLYSVFIISPT